MAAPPPPHLDAGQDARGDAQQHRYVDSSQGESHLQPLFRLDEPPLETGSAPPPATLSVPPLGGPIDALLKGRAGVGIVCRESFCDRRIDYAAPTPVDIKSVVAPDHSLARMPGPLHATGLTDHLQIVLAGTAALFEGRDFGVLSGGTWRVSTQGTTFR